MTSPPLSSRPMPSPNPRVNALCAEFDIRIVPKHRYPEPGETRAVATIERIIRRHGEAHVRLVLSVLAETKGNGSLIDETTLWAVSDLLIACADIIEADASAVLELFDELPLGPLIAITNELPGIVPQRSALAGILYFFLRRLRRDPLTSRTASTRKQREAASSEIEKGRPPDLKLGINEG